MDPKTNSQKPVDSQEELIKLANQLVETQTKRPTFKEKIKSRKFWIAAAGSICGICGMIGLNQNTTAMIVFAVLEIVSILAYCISEGMIDAKRSRQLAEAASTLFEMIAGSINADDYVKDNYDIQLHNDQAEVSDGEASETDETSYV